jgi:hypothetical protein
MKTKKQVSSAVELEHAFMLGAKWAANRLETSLAAHGMKYDAEITSVRVAQRIIAERPASEPAPPKRKASARRKKERPAGWAPAAWERYQASLSASTYAALDNAALSRKAMAACDRKEEVPAPINFRARFLYPSTQPVRDGKRTLPPPVDALLVGLGKLGAPVERIDVETKEQFDRKVLVQQASAALAEVQCWGYSTLTQHATKLYRARTIAAELLTHSDLRHAARELLCAVRDAERHLRAKYDDALPLADHAGHRPTREAHRAWRKQQRAGKVE